jgi:hypothetical protein
MIRMNAARAVVFAGWGSWGRGVGRQSFSWKNLTIVSRSRNTVGVRARNFSFISASAQLRVFFSLELPCDSRWHWCTRLCSPLDVDTGNLVIAALAHIPVFFDVGYNCAVRYTASRAPPHGAD